MRAGWQGQGQRGVARDAASRIISGAACAPLLLAGMLAGGCDTTLDSPLATYDDIEFTTYLKASPPRAGARLGQNLALDERTLVASAPFEGVTSADDVTAERAGALYVFDAKHLDAPPIRLTAPNADTDDGTFDPNLVPGSSAKENWGAMPIALDDDWIAVGIPGEDSGKTVGDDVTLEEAEASNDAQEAGAVYLYRRSHLDDAPIYLKAPNPTAADLFGAGLALSDGWLAVGAIGDSSADPDDDTNTDAPWSGAVYLYRYDDEREEFVLQQFLKPPSIHDEDMFGGAIAIEGDLMIVSASHDDGSGVGAGTDYDDRLAMDTGAIYTFRLRDGKWEYEAYLKPLIPDPSSLFGWSLSLVDGYIVTGTPFAFRCPGEQPLWLNGVVYVIGRKDGEWSDYQCLHPSDNREGSLFGFSLAGRGDRLVVGAGTQAPKGTGAAYSFERDHDGTWHERPKLIAPNHDEEDAFGAAVAMSPDALAIGAFGESGSQSDPDADLSDNGTDSSGAIYLYSM